MEKKHKASAAKIAKTEEQLAAVLQIVAAGEQESQPSAPEAEKPVCSNCCNLKDGHDCKKCTPCANAATCPLRKLAPKKWRRNHGKVAAALVRAEKLQLKLKTDKTALAKQVRAW
jgi:hypothetical protein